jgi:hypothetical protein
VRSRMQPSVPATASKHLRACILGLGASNLGECLAMHKSCIMLGLQSSAVPSGVTVAAVLLAQQHLVLACQRRLRSRGWAACPRTPA